MEVTKWSCQPIGTPKVLASTKDYIDDSLRRPCAGKLACTVVRGGKRSDAPTYPKRDHKQAARRFLNERADSFRCYPCRKALQNEARLWAVCKNEVNLAIVVGEKEYATALVQRMRQHVQPAWSNLGKAAEEPNIPAPIPDEVKRDYKGIMREIEWFSGFVQKMQPLCLVPLEKVPQEIRYAISHCAKYFFADLFYLYEIENRRPEELLHCYAINEGNLIVDRYWNQKAVAGYLDRKIRIMVQVSEDLVQKRNEVLEMMNLIQAGGVLYIDYLSPLRVECAKKKAKVEGEVLRLLIEQHVLPLTENQKE